MLYLMQLTFPSLFQMIFQVHLSPSANSYYPGQSVSLNMVTESSSWVALSAVDSAIYGVQGQAKKPMQRVK